MYNIPVKIDGIERRKRSTGLLHIIAGFFLIANGGTYFKHLNFEQVYLVIPFYIVAAASLFYGFVRKRFDPTAKYNHWLRLTQFLTFVILALVFLNFSSSSQVIGLFMWAVVTLFLMFTERKVFHDTFIYIKADGIHIPGYLKTHVVPWAIIESLVLRTDYITITRRDQKFVQLEIEGNLNSKEIETINQYSKGQIFQFAPLLMHT